MAFRYLNPVQQQYVSSFVPLPLEFLERQMSAKQGRYDQAQTLMAGAEDAFGGAEVNQADVAKKNEIINKYFGDVDEVVRSEYGEDYGNALNLIKRRVVGMGKDPAFSAFQKNVEGKKQYEDVRNRFIQSGQDFHEFDPNVYNQATYDPETGEARQIDYMSNIKGVEDADEIITKGTVNRLTRSVGDIALKAHKGLDGVLSYGTVQGISQKNIPGMITQADIDAVKKSAPTWVTKYGMTDEKIYEYIVNKAMSEVPYGVQSRYMSDPSYDKDDGDSLPVTPGAIQSGLDKKRDETVWTKKRGRKLIERNGDPRFIGNLLDKGAPYMAAINSALGNLTKPGERVKLDEQKEIYEGGRQRSVRKQKLSKSAKNLVSKFGDEAVNAARTAEEDFAIRHIEGAFFTADKPLDAMDKSVKNRLETMVIYDPDTEITHNNFSGFQNDLRTGLFKGKKDKADKVFNNAVPVGYTTSDMFPPNTLIMAADIGDGEIKHFIAVQNVSDPRRGGFNVIDKINMDQMDRRSREYLETTWQKSGRYEVRGLMDIDSNYKYGIKGYELKDGDGNIQTFSWRDESDLLNTLYPPLEK